MRTPPKNLRQNPASPVPRADLARVVGEGASVDLLIEDLAADLEGRGFSGGARI